MGSICIFYKREVTWWHDATRLPKCKRSLSQQGLGLLTCHLQCKLCAPLKVVEVSLERCRKPGHYLDNKPQLWDLKMLKFGQILQPATDLKDQEPQVTPDIHQRTKSAEGGRAIQSSSVPPDRFGGVSGRFTLVSTGELLPGRRARKQAATGCDKKRHSSQAKSEGTFLASALEESKGHRRTDITRQACGNTAHL